MVAVPEDESPTDDIEQFVARVIVQPPPPFNADTDHVITDRVNNNDVTVTSAGSGHVTSDHNANSVAGSSASYRRAACIDKTTAIYANLPKRRPSDLPPPPPPLSRLLNHHVNDNLATDSRLQTTLYDGQRQFDRRSLRWYDCVDDSLSRLAVCPTTSLRPTSLQHE